MITYTYVTTSPAAFDPAVVWAGSLTLAGWFLFQATGVPERARLALAARLRRIGGGR